MSIEAKIRESLEGKTAVITGASAGFGWETAVKLASYGVRVLAVARREDKLKELAKVSKLIEPRVMDITKDVYSLGREKVDILINNAGLALGGRDSFEKTKPEDWNEVLDTNVKGLMAVTWAVLPGMVERNFGDIINIGSIAGLFTYPGGSVYCASKFAVHALSQVWRQDLNGKNIRVIEICPGMAETEFSLVRFQGDVSKAKAVYQGMTPLSAEDIAETIVWTLSRPRHVTIQNIVVMPSDQATVGMVHRK